MAFQGAINRSELAFKMNLGFADSEHRADVLPSSHIACLTQPPLPTNQRLQLESQPPFHS